jgi:hypothetical protein
MAETPRLKVLFLCTGNSCRSQMAEAWARALKAEEIDPYSAGVSPHGLDPRAVKAMAPYRRVREEIKAFVQGLPRSLGRNPAWDPPPRYWLKRHDLCVT